MATGFTTLDLANLKYMFGGDAGVVRLKLIERMLLPRLEDSTPISSGADIRNLIKVDIQGMPFTDTQIADQVRAFNITFRTVQGTLGTMQQLANTPDEISKEEQDKRKKADSTI